MASGPEKNFLSSVPRVQPACAQVDGQVGGNTTIRILYQLIKKQGHFWRAN